jgi:flagellum-specific peptidoglycan hydrolase FlgJ
MALHKWLDIVKEKAMHSYKHMERYNNDPAYRQKSIEMMKRYVKDNREKINSYYSNRLKTDPIFRKKVRAYWRKRYATDSKYREKEKERFKRRYRENREAIKAKRRLAYRRKTLNTH